ncbi:MAG: SDR family oxidoreductase [Pseudomonadota bacterium]
MDFDQLMFKPGFLSGQRILVTGGGTGLGKEMATALSALGAHVYICGRRTGVLQETAGEIAQATSGTVSGVGCDIRSSESIDAMLNEIWTDGGALTGLINNAAGNFISRTQDLSIRGFDAIANIVMRGTFDVTHNAGKRWIAEGVPASVVSIVVTWVWNGSPFVVPSAMSKSALRAMTQSLAVEWGGHGIRLNAIAPGIFPTEGATKRLAPGAENPYEDMSGNPMGRTGHMHELANLATFLLGPGAEYLNGQTIAIDGGEYLATGGNFSFLRQWTDQNWADARAAIEKTHSEDRKKRD